jgi:hypothetical protein
MKQLRAHIDRQPLVGIFVAKEGHEKGLTNTSEVEEIGKNSPKFIAKQF